MLNLVHFSVSSTSLILMILTVIDVRSIGARTSVLSCRSIKLALRLRNFMTLKACALVRVLNKPVTWSRLSKLLDNREDCHQAP